MGKERSVAQEMAKTYPELMEKKSQISFIYLILNVKYGLDI